ncbi:MAG: FAD-dependent oxidoreductase, partial [Clostridiales bacterium]
MDKYDLLIVGAGPGGYVGALKAAQLGMKVAIAESRQIGGTCLNRGCIPTKTLLHSAAILREIKNCATLGIEVAGVDFDFAAMHRRKNQVVEQLRGGVEALLKANKIDLLAGKAKVTAIGQTEVAGRTIVADKILLAAGSVPLLLPLPGADSARVLTSDDILSGEQPFFPRLLIIGGGVIGMEFAAFFNDLGGEVTVLESLDRVLANFDKSISQNLSMIMKKRGVKVYTAAQAIRMESDEQGICCYFRHKEQELSVTGDALLMAVGRRAASADLVAADMDLQLERGRIRTDQRYQ